MIDASEMEKARQEIDAIDREMTALFEKRMRACERVARYKKENGLSVVDEGRQSEVLRRNSALVSDDAIREYYALFIKDVMRCSVAYQERINSGMKVAYTGVPGAFAYIAAKKAYPSANLVPCADFAASYAKVADGECDAAILPIENSTAGDVGTVLDLIWSGDLHINQMVSISVRQNLLAVKGATIESIRTVVSHPQALAQAAEFVRRHGFACSERVNTAVAAQEVAEKKDPSLAAIASVETARLYGLEVIERDVNVQKGNSTRFACFSRSLDKRPKRGAGEGFIIVFSVSNEVGSLAKALDIISSNGFNMRNLRSRPMKSELWRYYFYAELEGYPFSEEGEDLMIQLKTVCDELKLAGSYEMNAGDSV